MKYAFISDLHANLPAVEAVLGDLDARTDLDAVHHLGDLVGYAPWPNEVVELLEDRRITGVAGNYDSTVAHGHDHCGCRYDDPREAELSHRSFSWTRDHVSAETRRRLGTLPFGLEIRVGGGHASGPTLHLFHGAPTLNTLYWHEDRDDGFCVGMAERVGARAGDVLAFGHTHVPWHREVEGIHFVNAGSVGRPKDGDPRACYVVLEMGAEARGPGATTSAAEEKPGPERVRVEFIRVEYDVDRAVRGIEESDLPDDFGTILRTGGSLQA